MEYPDFLSYIQESVGTIVGQDYAISLHKIIKNNDIELDALTITGNGSNVSPSIYLNDYYTEYLQGRPLGEIVYEIYAIYEEHHGKVQFDIQFFSDFQQVRPKLMGKLINYEANQKLLDQVPYVKILDFAVVFYCLISNDSFGNATALIRQEHVRLWNTTTEELYQCAMQNTPELLPPKITHMDELVREMLISKLQEDYFSSELEAETIPESDSLAALDKMADDIIASMHNSYNVEMYILTNTQQLNGSICILYEGILKNFAKKMNSDLFILPSSIHEVILIPYSEELSPKRLNEIVQEVNSTEVEAGEILSDHIYHYHLDTDNISILF